MKRVCDGSQSAIDLAAMSDQHNYHEVLGGVHLINDSIITDAKAKQLCMP